MTTRLPPFFAEALRSGPNFSDLYGHYFVKIDRLGNPLCCIAMERCPVEGGWMAGPDEGIDYATDLLAEKSERAAADAENAYNAYVKALEAAQAASPAHRGVYLTDTNIDAANALDAGITRNTAEFWITCKASATMAYGFRLEEAGLPPLNGFPY